MKSSPIKISLKTEALAIVIILISIISSVYFYLNFPDQVPTHWGVDGQVNGWSGKTFGAFFMPILNIGVYLLLLWLPYLDPKKENYSKFISIYHGFKNSILALLFAIYLITGLAGLGYDINVGAWITGLIGVLFIVIGFYLGKIKSNWTIGFRNMWTLSSEKVWDKTNRLAGKVFILTGILIAISTFLPNSFILPVFIIAITISILVPMIASYVWYQQENKK